ncbi:type I-U CRISPR-associated protein Csb2 [Micromonospora sp. NPDC050276]|uniref:type I-G CRISPR-associated protein Csb2 n=1 Tax=Micromonospora sp. NPDC050276 TaxID=3364278 RepID=UPI00378AC3EB
MALTITMRLREGRYDAASAADQVEWPPHPARLFCALVASAEHETGAPSFQADDAALRWLEAAGPPLVLASPVERVVASRRTGFVVTNATSRKPGSMVWPGRTARESSRAGGLPPDDRVAFVWPQATAEDGVLWRLSRLARRVPYVGRSTSSAQVEVSDEEVVCRGSWMTHRPVPIGTRGSVALRVPYPGYLQDLREAYERGQRAWEMSRAVAYAADDVLVEEPPVPSVAGPYGELVVWPVARGGVPIGGDRLLSVAEVARRAVISRIADPVPAQASGHGADGRAHLAFLPLLDVGHRHADGHLLGVAVAIPGDLDRKDRLAVLRGLLGADGEDPIRELRGHGSVGIRLEDPAQPPTGWGVRPDRWTGGPAGLRRWVTATPVMLDRYPGRRGKADELLAAAFVTAGFPEPESVTVLEGPVVRGAVTAPRRGTIPAGRDRRPMLHCRVRFPVPVRGPVIAGALRYLGCGVLVPEVSRAER